jgi:hypothetical protein
LIFVADHRIRRVDRLVDGDAGKAEEGIPQHRRHDAVGAVLRKAFERRAGDAGLVQPGRIAAHDQAHRLAGLGERAGQRGMDVKYMIFQGSLRNEGGGQQHLHQPAEPPVRENVGDHIGREEGRGDQNGKCCNPPDPAFGRAHARLVKSLIQIVISFPAQTTGWLIRLWIACG